MKVYLSQKVSGSRLPNFLPKFINREIAIQQVADVVVRKDRKHVYSIVYLPMDYHRQNPGYLSWMIDEVQKQRKKRDQQGKTLVLLLVQNKDETRSIANAQIECMKKDVNMILCFEVLEAAQMIVDILQLKQK